MIQIWNILYIWMHINVIFFEMFTLPRRPFKKIVLEYYDIFYNSKWHYLTLKSPYLGYCSVKGSCFLLIANRKLFFKDLTIVFS